MFGPSTLWPGYSNGNRVNSRGLALRLAAHVRAFVPCHANLNAVRSREGWADVSAAADCCAANGIEPPPQTFELSFHCILAASQVALVSG